MNWLHYLVEANIYLGVFYLCYCLFLNNETHYLLGRAYLLFSCVVSFVLPVTQLSVLKPVEQLTLQPVVYTQPANYGPLPEITIIEPEKNVSMDDVLFYAYIAGAIITLSVLFYRLYRLSLLTRKSKALYGNKYKLIQLNGDNTAFSFFNYLFIGTEVPQADTIIAHELVHMRQRHSADIIFVELLKVVSWFNPFIYLLQRSLRSIHEYIADEQAAAQERDALTYSSFLLNNAYGLQGSPIAHSFFNYNLLKKRIIMLNQKRSGRLARLKYLAAVPLCVGMLCASTLVFSKDYALIDLAPKATPVEKPTAIDSNYTLKIVDKKGMTLITDKVTLTDKKHGINKFYSANTLTQKDIDDAFKVDGTVISKVTRESVKIDTNKRKLFPPLPPYSLRKPYEAISAYLHKTIKFPAEALKANENGAVVFSFKLDAAGKINDIKVLQSKGNGYEAVAIKALQDYPYPIKEAAGKKILEMNFWLPNNQATYLASNKTRMIPGFVGNIIFHNETTPGNIPNLPPPPPPHAPKKIAAVPPKVKLAPPVVIADLNPKAAPEIEIVPVPAVKVKVKAAPKVLIDVKPVPQITIDPLPAIAPAKPAKAAKPAKVKAIKLAPPVVVPNTPEIKIDEQPATPKVGQTKYKKAEKSFIIPPSPPLKNAQLQGPPPAYDKAYVALYSHMTRAIHYPNAAIENKTTGNVVLSYRVNASHKIIDIKVLKSIGKGCDEAMITALKQYKGTIAKPEGEYFIAGAFILNKYSKAFESLGDLRFKPNFTGWVVVAANAMMSNDKTANIIQNSPTADMVRPIIAFQANK